MPSRRREDFPSFFFLILRRGSMENNGFDIGSSNYNKLQINLYKDWNGDIAPEKCDAAIFGYYDYMTIKRVESWHKFRPTGKSLEGSEGIKNIDAEYIIRLISPEVGDGANGICWNGQGDNSYPFIACCLINFTDDYLKHNLLEIKWEQAFLNFKNQISENYKNFGDCAHLKYSVYYCLGYSDVVVLVNSNNFKTIGNFMQMLRKLNWGNKNIVSTMYSVTGIFTKNKDVDAVKDIISLSIDLSYKTEKSESDGAGVIGKDDSRSLIAGCFDWRITKDVKQSDLSKLYVEDWSSFKKWLKDSNTKLMLMDDSGACNSSKGVVESEATDYLKELNNAFAGFCNAYSQIANKYNFHRRVLGAVENIKKMYDKLASTQHSHEVRLTIGKVFCSFLKAMSHIFEKMLENDPGSESGFDFEFYQQCDSDYARFIEDSVEDFRKVVNSLLFDIWRADNSFFEGQTIAHPSVGSTIKLLFAYNATLNCWDKAWRNILGKEQGNKHAEYSYLVASGGRDTTTNYDLFDGVANTCSRPILVLMSEAGLYDVSGALFRLAHEFFHKCGNRERKNRSKHFLTGLCRGFAEYLELCVRIKLVQVAAQYIYLSFNNGRENWEKDIFWDWIYGCDYFKRCPAKTYGSKPECEYCSICRNNSHRVGIQQSVSRLEQEIKKINSQSENDYQSFVKSLTDLFKQIVGAFSGEKINSDMLYENCMNVLFEKLFRAAECVEASLGKGCSGDPMRQIITQINNRLVDVARNLKCENDDFSALYKLKFNDAGGQKLKERLTTDFMQNLRNFCFNGFTGENRYLVTWLEDSSNMEVLYGSGDNIGLLYKECFADCMAIKAMGFTEFGQYLCSMMYEMRGIDYYLKQREELKIKPNTFNALRFGVVWEALGYNDSWIGKDFESAIKKYYSQVFYPFNKNDFSAEKYAAEMVQAAKELNDRYKELKNYGIIRELVAYLKSAIENTDNVELCRAINDNVKEVVSSTTEDKVYDEPAFINYLMKGWYSLHAVSG